LAYDTENEPADIIANYDFTDISGIEKTVLRKKPDTPLHVMNHRVASGRDRPLFEAIVLHGPQKRP
jgi:hypothetical protein